MINSRYVAMINKDPNIIPILHNPILDKGRYAISIEENTGDISILERGTLRDNSYMYYMKTVKVYGDGSVYLYPLHIHSNEKQKFNVNRLLKQEMKYRKG